MPPKHMPPGHYRTRPPPTAAAPSHGYFDGRRVPTRDELAASLKHMPKARSKAARQQVTVGPPPDTYTFPDPWQEQMYDPVFRPLPTEQLWQLPTFENGRPEKMMYGGNHDKCVGPLTSPKAMEFFTHRGKAQTTQLSMPPPTRPEATGMMYCKLVDNYDGRQFIDHADGKVYDVLREDAEDCKKIIDRMTTAQMVKHYGFKDTRLRTHANGYRTPEPESEPEAEPEPTPEPEPEPTPEPEPEPDTTEEVVRELVQDLVEAVASEVTSAIVPRVLEFANGVVKLSPKSALNPSDRAVKAARSSHKASSSQYYASSSQHCGMEVAQDDFLEAQADMRKKALARAAKEASASGKVKADKARFARRAADHEAYDAALKKAREVLRRAHN